MNNTDTFQKYVRKHTTKRKTQETFQKFTKRKTHESDHLTGGNLYGRKGRKKDCYSEMRGLKRNWEQE